MGIDMAWAEKQTFSRLLVHVISVGEATGGTFDYKNMRWQEKATPKGR